MFDYQRVIKLQKFLGLSGSKFATSLGIPVSTYNKFTKGGKTLDMGVAGKILEVYKVHPNWLFFGEGGEDPVFLREDKETKVSIEEYKQLEEEKFQVVMELKEAYKALAEERKVKNTKLKNIEGADRAD